MCPGDETDSERQRCTPHSIAEYTVPLERHNRTLQPCAGNNVSTHRFIESGVRTTPAHLEIWPPYLTRNKATLNLLLETEIVTNACPNHHTLTAERMTNVNRKMAQNNGAVTIATIITCYVLVVGLRARPR